MADIFSVEPPRWLQEIARPIDSRLTGQVAGTMLGGGINALADGTSFGQGFQEGRLAQQDPLWKLSAAAKQAQVAGAIAQAESAHWLANERKQKYLNWEEDLRTGVLDYVADPNADPSNPPRPKSQEAVELLNRKFAASSANKIAVNAARTWDTALQKLSERGGKYAVIAGEFAQFAGQPPTPDVRKAFGERLKEAGMTEDEVFTNATRDLPVQRVTQGPRGTVVTYGESKPFSAVGKLKADMQSARDAGATDEDLADYRNAIANATTRKWETATGKAQSDLDRAKQENKPESVIKSLEAQVQQIEQERQLYAEAPEIITANGKQFLKWGKTLRNLEEINALQKTEASIVSADIKELQKRLLDYEDGSKEAESIRGRLLDARLKLNKIFSGKRANSSGVQSQPISGQTGGAPAVKAAPPAPSTVQSADQSAGGSVGGTRFLFNPKTGQLEPVK